MKNVKEGHTIFAEATVLRKTNHVVFVDVKVYSDEGDILSKGKVTMILPALMIRFRPSGKG